MKTRFPYREFSLVIGILVAVIVAFTLWMGTGSRAKQSQGLILLRSVSLHTSPNVVVKKVKMTKSFSSEAFSLALPSSQNNLY